MKRLGVAFLLVLLCCGACLAKLSVSPVIIEEMHVNSGHLFEINCQQHGTEQVELELSLALFDQDAGGSVFFLEDEVSLHKVRQFLSLEQERLLLEPNQQRVVQVAVESTDFDHLYAVLFIKPTGAGVPTRLAVLLLLSTLGSQGELDISFWEQSEHYLDLTVRNIGRSHGFWAGQLLCFDASNRLSKTLPVQSGIVLAGRSRDLQINLPSWVQRVELSPGQFGEVK